MIFLKNALTFHFLQMCLLQHTHVLALSPFSPLYAHFTTIFLNVYFHFSPFLTVFSVISWFCKFTKTFRAGILYQVYLENLCHLFTDGTAVIKLLKLSTISFFKLVNTSVCLWNHKFVYIMRGTIVRPYKTTVKASIVFRSSLHCKFSVSLTRKKCFRGGRIIRTHECTHFIHIQMCE